MSTPIRGTEAVKAMRDLFSDYLVECDRIEEFKRLLPLCTDEHGTPGNFDITNEETLEVFERRRDAIAAKLENKGFKVTAESNDTLPSIARAQAEQRNDP